MSKSPSGPAPSRRPSAKARAPSKIALTKDPTSPPVRGRKTIREPIAKDEASELGVTSGESSAAGMVEELPARPRRSVRPRKCKPPSAPRFRIFIIDSGWNTVARRVLRHNFSLIRRLHKEEFVYLLSRKKSAEFIRRHRSLIGRDPIIAVHDLEAMDRPGIARFSRLSSASRDSAYPETNADGAADLRPICRDTPPLAESRGRDPQRASPREYAGHD